LADRRGADEEIGLERQTDALRDLDDRANVILVRAARRARSHVQLLLDDLAREALDSLLHVRPRAGQTDVGVIDADVVHVMKDADLVVERRITDRRRLKSVAQRLVVEFDLARRLRRLLAGDVPVVDEVGEVVGHSVAVYRKSRVVRFCRTARNHAGGHAC
jgi:hypothetical protein